MSLAGTPAPPREPPDQLDRKIGSNETDGDGRLRFTGATVAVGYIGVNGIPYAVQVSEAVSN
jgi:hypothetical protein